MARRAYPTLGTIKHAASSRPIRTGTAFPALPKLGTDRGRLSLLPHTTQPPARRNVATNAPVIIPGTAAAVCLLRRPVLVRQSLVALRLSGTGFPVTRRLGRELVGTTPVGRLPITSIRLISTAATNVPVIILVAVAVVWQIPRPLLVEEAFRLILLGATAVPIFRRGTVHPGARPGLLLITEQTLVAISAPAVTLGMAVVARKLFMIAPDAPNTWITNG